jgi:hypothetical protein
MMNAILLAVAALIETAVSYAIVGILIAFAVLGIIAVSRWLLSNFHVGGYLKRSNA